jgi:hypothetical protein
MPRLPKTIQYAPKGNITELINEAIAEALGGESLSFSYNLDGTVDTISSTSKTLTFGYNLDGTVDTITDGTITRTFSYNLDGTVDQIIVS